MTLFDSGFATSTFGDLQYAEFTPRTLLPSSEVAFSAEDARASSSVEPSVDISESQIEREFESELEDAFNRGFEEGCSQTTMQMEALQNQQQNLVEAIGGLAAENEDILATRIWTMVADLLVEAIGTAHPDEALMLARSKAALKMLASNATDIVLYVAESDASFFEDESLDITVTVDPQLLRGSVRLVHTDGQIIAGSAAVVSAVHDKIARSVAQS